jgi:addiction module RelE/StbE family toxin
MAEIIWSQDAVDDAERIREYIAVQNPAAGEGLLKRIYEHVLQLADHPLSGPQIPELRGGAGGYRQIVEPPCRIFYRVLKGKVLVLNVIRGEMRFSKPTLLKRMRKLKD